MITTKKIVYVSPFDNLPKDWSVVKLKYLIRSKITDGPHVTPDFIPEGIPFLSVDGIQNGELDLENTRFISREEHNLYRKKANVEYGDILMGKAASIGKIARVKTNIEFGIWSPLALIKPNESKVKSTYLEYFLKSVVGQDQIENLATSNTQKNISMDDIPKIIVVLPPLTSQDKVISYLNTKIEQIIKFIDDKKKLISLLEEQKRIIIFTALTKGLDKNVKLKSSGVEWLEAIPADWELKSLKYVLKEDKASIKAGPFGSDLKSEHISETGPVKVYTQANIIADDIEIGSSFIDKKHSEVLKEFTVQSGDILLSSRGTIGRVLIIPKEFVAGVIHSSVIRVRIDTNKISNDFLKLIIEDSGYFLENLLLASNATTIEVIYAEKLKETKVLVPPISIQKNILERLKLETHKVDQAIHTVQQEIELIEEYKKSLIYQAVTGKIETLLNNK